MTTSEYDPIWTGLKASEKKPKQFSITANKALHPRIIKAISKRKNLDVGYKIELEPKKALLSHSRDGSKLTFYLTFSITADDF